MEPNPVVKKFIAELRINPLFFETMKELKKFRPVVPAYRPCQSTEETQALWESIKYETGRQQGFDKIYLLLTGEKPNE
jgi:hypothetical protein